MNNIKTICTEKAPAAIGPYSQGKCVGGFLFLSGQIPLDPVTGEVAGNTIEEQTEQIMKNIAAVLESEGATMDQVLKTTCFLTSMDNFAAFNEVYGKYFPSKPGRSCVAVKQLPKEVLAEVEVIAYKG
ncbi:RidA family protein [Clostridium sp. P21]|uniref:RidA family protein n=1 Tax=Clostridium muellerianum TaxID=2716538 RepID=A0A7Y0EH57_9CLOT|nr:RidA family protein [Clostridium muellerianum]NMM63386.1 RidA family protein [Clostridium muellerianum]